jgi:hypothetical protein
MIFLARLEQIIHAIVENGVLAFTIYRRRPAI